MYAADAPNDDGWLGGDEVNDLCDILSLESRCMNPYPDWNWRNDAKPGPPPKGKKNKKPAQPPPSPPGGQPIKQPGKSGDEDHWETCAEDDF
ncbi:hypothetical protein FKW77_005354 [Venturia effusa]|uniref:Uncharacterized protein n=1 Tax=Venturia effusa TaxID=50376 RepID=A0A517LMT7_9PEZI|nr:hypothetical protein FKW77_005354 [Venturia effusa]